MVCKHISLIFALEGDDISIFLDSKQAHWSGGRHHLYFSRLFLINVFEKMKAVRASLWKAIEIQETNGKLSPNRKWLVREILELWVFLAFFLCSSFPVFKSVLENFFCKGTDIKHFTFCEPYDFFHYYSTQMF